LQELASLALMSWSFEASQVQLQSVFLAFFQNILIFSFWILFIQHSVMLTINANLKPSEALWPILAF